MSGRVPGVTCRRRRVWSLMMVAIVVMSCCVTAAGKGTTSSKRSSVSSTGPPRKKKGSSSTSKKSSSKKKVASKRRAYEDDEDDEDDTYEAAVEPYYRPRRKGPAGPTMWQRGMVMAHKAAHQAMVSGKHAAERAKVLGAEAAVKAQEASRLAKAYYSSEYEKFLLTATWPSDQRIPPHLTKRLVESVARFPARPHSLPEDDPYRVTLRKLWKKMVEKDWRTSLKSLTLIHALSRQTPLKNSRALSRVLKSMLGDADPKTGRKYFNRRDLVSLKKDLKVAKLVDDYNGLVLRRALLFAGKLEDVTPKKKVCDASPRRSVADSAKRAGNALLVLDHAVQFCDTAFGIGRGGSSGATKVSDTHLVVVGCLELVVADINDALALATDQLKPLAALNVTVEDGVGKTAAADAAKALQKYDAILPKLQKATRMALKTLRFFDLKAHADLKVSIPELRAAVDKWNAIADESPEEEEDDDDDFEDDDDDDDEEDEDDDDDDLDEDEDEYEDEDDEYDEEDD